MNKPTAVIAIILSAVLLCLTSACSPQNSADAETSASEPSVTEDVK